jgi:hypothetical protein
VEEYRVKISLKQAVLLILLVLAKFFTLTLLMNNYLTIALSSYHFIDTISPLNKFKSSKPITIILKVFIA